MPTTSSTLVDNSDPSNAIKDFENIGSSGECNDPFTGSVSLQSGSNVFWQVDLWSIRTVYRIRIKSSSGHLNGEYTNLQFKVCDDATRLRCTLCDNVFDMKIMFFEVFEACKNQIHGFLGFLSLQKMKFMFCGVFLSLQKKK